MHPRAFSVTALLALLYAITAPLPCAAERPFDRQLEDLVVKLQRETISEKEFDAKLTTLLKATPPEKAVLMLIQLLEARRKDADVRALAARILGEIGGDSASLPLLRATGDPEWWVRARAIQALGQLKHERAAERAIAALADTESIVREFAADALGDLREPTAAPRLVESLADEDILMRGHARRALVQIGTPAVEPLIAGLDRLTPEGREGAIEALGELRDSRAVGPLISVLKGADSLFAGYARRALVQIGDPALDLLLVQLKDRRNPIRERVADTLGDIKNIRAVGPMLSSLRDELDTSDIADIAYPISRMGPQALRPTLEVMRTDYLPVLCGAVMVLGLLGEKRAAPAVTAFALYERAKTENRSNTCYGRMVPDALKSLGSDVGTLALPDSYRPRVPEGCSPQAPREPPAEPTREPKTILEQSERLHEHADKEFERYRKAMACVLAMREGEERAKKDFHAAVDAVLFATQ